MTDVRIVTESLGGSRLSQLLQQGKAPAEWLASIPRTPDAWIERAAQRARERSWDACWDALAPALAATGRAAERLERVRSTGGIVVTTGQQPGLFGGPVYTWSKALSALALADALERETGVATAAVFWAATDDADFAEASYTVLARSGGVDVLRSEHAPVTGTPMSFARLGDMAGQLARLRDAAGSVADPRALAAVAHAYGDSSRTVGDAFIRLLRELLSPLGVPVLDASHPAVRDASRPTLEAALRNADAIEASLETRRKEMVSRGYEPQVEDVRGLSLVFARAGTTKRRLSVGEAPSVIADTDITLTPNVLLRAVVEQAILPTVAYLGGPGEIAYFAQVSAVADAMGVARPVVLPRWSCTLVEPHIDELLRAFDVTPDALSRPDELEGTIARGAMRDSTAQALALLRRAVDSTPSGLAPDASQLGMEAAVKGATLSLLHRVDRLERRLLAAIKRREHATLRDVATLRAALYPRGTRQERALNLVPMLSRHGLEVMDEMRDAASAHASALTGRSARNRPS